MRDIENVVFENHIYILIDNISKGLGLGIDIDGDIQFANINHRALANHISNALRRRQQNWIGRWHCRIELVALSCMNKKTHESEDLKHFGQHIK